MEGTPVWVGQTIGPLPALDLVAFRVSNATVHAFLSVMKGVALSVVGADLPSPSPSMPAVRVDTSLLLHLWFMCGWQVWGPGYHLGGGSQVQRDDRRDGNPQPGTPEGDTLVTEGIQGESVLHCLSPATHVCEEWGIDEPLPGTGLILGGFHPLNNAPGHS